MMYTYLSGISIRAVAIVTMLSMILSAFPASFFVAFAQEVSAQELSVPAELITISGDTSVANGPGWLFNADPTTATPFEFNTDTNVIGNGALFVPPISGANKDDKFIGTHIVGTPIADILSYSYDFNIAGVDASDENEFYLNVYANYGNTVPGSVFFDCRYNVVPTVGVVGGFTTVTFDPTQTYPVAKNSGSASTVDCPTSPAGMNSVVAGSYVTFFALNAGDTGETSSGSGIGTDAGVSGYFDNVIFETVEKTTIYDFEPEAVPAKKISPVFECWVDNEDDTATGYFGYSNPNDFTVDIEIGDDNKVNGPSAPDAGQPTEFMAGRTGFVDDGGVFKPENAAFSVTYPTSGNLTWTLNGKTATAGTPDNKMCPEPPRPVDECFDANLLLNGSFEEPEVTNTSKWQKMSSVPGWDVTKVSDDTSTSLELMRGIFDNEAAEGEQYVELDGDQSTKVAQTVATQARGTYELKWSFAGRHNAGGDIQNQLDVLVNGNSVATSGPQTDPAGLDYDDWTEGSYTFMALTDSTEISFADLGPSNSFGTYLDNARLCLVKEPAPAPTPCSLTGEVVAITEDAKKFDGSPVDADRRSTSSLSSVAPYINFFGQEGNGWSTSDFLSLGVEGSVTYKFTGKVAIDQIGDDIAIWEVTGGPTTQQTNAKAIVEVSQNGVDFYNLGTIVGDGAVDIAPSGYAYVQYVRVTDDSRLIGNADGGDGYDIDAITIIDGSCSDYATINTTKIVCDLESELPNWGAGSANITTDTATDWLATNLEQNPDTTCRLVDGWEFEWADRGTKNPGNTYVGSGGSEWNTFTGSTLVPLELVDNTSFWMREVLEEGYIPFTGGNKKDESAEMYCHKDVLNYDNFDRIDKPVAGGEYSCVAWNVPKELPPQQCTLLSDDETLVKETNENATSTYVHGNWTDDIDDAAWVWATERVENPTTEEMYTFIETFTVSDPVSAQLEVAADNLLRVTINGVEVLDKTDQNNFVMPHTVDLLPFLTAISGEYTIEFEVTNLAGADDYRKNPAGVLYRLDIEVEGRTGSCVITTEPEEEIYIIDGYKFIYIGEGDEPDGGWLITATNLDTDEVATTTTNEAGYYRFELPAGEWEISEEDRFGWMQDGVEQYPREFLPLTVATEVQTESDDYDNYDTCIFELPMKYELPDDRFLVQVVDTIVFWDDSEEEFNGRCNFYNYETEEDSITIEGFKYQDANGNGILDSGEAGIGGWLITATEIETDEVATTTTAGDGFYSFTLPFGEWEISEELPLTGWTQTAVYADGVLVENDLTTCYFNSNPVYEDDLEQSRSLDSESDTRTCDFLNQPDPIVSTNGGGNGGAGATRIAQQLGDEQVLGATATQCPFLVDFMQISWNNNPWEVIKLQLFLQYQGYVNPLTAVFDTTTEANVKAFQEVHKAEILTPWFEAGIVPHQDPTGFVYKTTRWKINDIVCPGYEAYPSFDGEDLTQNIYQR